MLPLITSAVAVLVKEQPVFGSRREQNNSLDSNTGFLASSKSSMIQLWGAVKQPNVFLPTLFIFLWQATPHSDSAMFYFTYVEFFFLKILIFSIISSICLPSDDDLESFCFQYKQTWFHSRVSGTCKACNFCRITAWCWTLQWLLENYTLEKDISSDYNYWFNSWDDSGMFHAPPFNGFQVISTINFVILPSFRLCLSPDGTGSWA